MRVPVLTQHARFLLRSGAVLVIAGAAAGCSSGTMRFQDAVFPNSASRAQASGQVAQQSYGQPYTPPQAGNVDQTYTGSVYGAAPVGTPGRRAGAPVPSADVGHGGGYANARYTPSAQPLPAPSTVAAQPYPSISEGGRTVTRQAMAAPAAPGQLDGMATGTVSAPPRQTAAIQQTAGNWSRAGGTLVEARAGDTVSTLSRRYGVPADALGKVNGLTADARLAQGQRIVVPTYDAGGSSAVKTAGNQTNSPGPSQAPQQHVAVLPQGQRPDGKPAAIAPQPAQPKANAAAADGSVYTVQSGDTLSSIAGRFGTSTTALRQANGLDTALIRVGQKLVIPGAAGKPQTVAAAQQPKKAVDPVSTGTVRPAEKPAAVAGYTPPRQEEKAIEQAVRQEAAAPDATGIGRMRWPARGRVISGFGGASGDKKNDGIDIAVPEGTSVKAAENGVVIYAGDGLKDFGKTVLVRHENGLVTVYGHASNIAVARGDTVRRGQEIARSGISGNAATPRLHFEVRKNSTPVDPVKFLE